mgnify:FL=1
MKRVVTQDQQLLLHPGHQSRTKLNEQEKLLARLKEQHDTQTNNTHDRRPIDELVAEYAAEGCDFTDRVWMHNVVARHVETMPDSLARCLLHVLRPPAEDPCFCCSDISLQIVSGGGSQEGYLGRITCLVDGKYVDYVRTEHARGILIQNGRSIDGDGSMIVNNAYQNDE